MPSTASPNSDSAAEGTAAESLRMEPEGAGSTWGTGWRLMRFTFAVDARGFLITVATALVGSLAEGTGLVLLLPLLSVAGMDFSGSSTAGRLSSAMQRLLT